MIFRRTAVLCSMVLSVSSVLWLGVRPAAAVTGPAPTYSYYMSTVSQSTLYNLGYSFGQKTAAGNLPNHALIIFDFGTPYCNANSCGTYLVGGCGCYYDTATERAAVEQFAEGYYIGTGSDTSAFAYLALGTSNYGSWFSNGSNANRHGTWWAGAVTDMETWLKNNGYASQTAARGAIDAEMDWNAPTPTLDWASGYTSNYTARYWDFGDAAGCPNCDNGWTENDVYTLMWGDAPAFPFPEIYNSGMATEWGELADYAYDNKGVFVSFLGPVSQYQACIDTGNSCTGEDDTPTQSWDQLYNSLSCSTDCPDPQAPSSETDIRWKLVA